jgi:glycosyltransferase involved in cell wall biosynthesis
MRVLVSAYACGPGRASEPGIGWNAVSEIARDHDVWVLTSCENRDSIEETLARTPAPVQFVFVDVPSWLSFVKRSRVGFEVQQYCWQIAAYLKARGLHAQLRFDLAHHVTIGRYWMPTLLPFLRIPCIWGPVGGGDSAPKPFWRGLGFQGALLEAVREMARFVGERDPLLRLAAKRIALGVATTPETSARMRTLAVSRVEVFTHVALNESDLAALDASRAPHASGHARFISIGRLVPWKGFHLALRAFARMQHVSAQYWIVGDGPAERSLKALADQLGVSSRVRFLGRLSRDEVLATLQQCDVLVHPSLHESGGAVCAEAMAAGRPVICLDLGGPGLQVNAETGIKVPARKPSQVIRDLAEAMDTMSQSPTLRARMGHAARARVHDHFSTHAWREQFRRWYLEVAGVS